MGNSGSSIGDIFYPDNPNRRRRAEELRQDINDIVNQFQEQKQLRYIRTVPLPVKYCEAYPPKLNITFPAERMYLRG